MQEARKQNRAEHGYPFPWTQPEYWKIAKKLTIGQSSAISASSSSSVKIGSMLVMSLHGSFCSLETLADLPGPLFYF